MIKRFSKLLLGFLIVFGTFFSLSGLNSAEASTKNFQVHDPEIKTLTEKVYLKIDEKGKTVKASKSEVESIKKLAKENYNNSKQKSLNNTKKVDPEALISNEEKSITPESTTVNYAEVKYETTFNSTNSTITLKSTITSLIGNKPVIILAGYDLFSSKTLEGTYSKVTGFDVEWTGAQIYVGKSYSKTYTVTSTNFWMTQNTTTAGWTGSLPVTKTGQAGPVLSNKKASLYPVIKNEHSGQFMPIPTKANMPVVPLEDRVPWNNTLRGQYITAYINTYGNPNWDWSLLDIHHVIPREYGGTNSFYNLFPLPRDLHQQRVTPWWSSY